MVKQTKYIPKFLLFEVITPHRHRKDALREFRELESLVRTYGGETVVRDIQHRIKPHPATYIGRGKIEKIKDIIQKTEIDIIVVNDIVNSGQIFRLEKSFWEIKKSIVVWDRVDLILKVFERHASSTEAKLQIELARIKHLGPRIYGTGKTLLSRQAGGIGTRGIGETNIEIMKRHLRRREKYIRNKLKKVTRFRKSTIKRRQNYGYKTIALVGYTNAGKTSLFNKLTRKNKRAKNSLFTTLDSVVGEVKGGDFPRKVLVSDTIGFIENLPPFLLDSFRSTLLESINADLLLQIVDVSEDDFEKKIQIVNEILAGLSSQARKKVLVFNKEDLISDRKKKFIKTQFNSNCHFLISVESGYNFGQLRQKLLELIKD